jgi:Sec-independent protein translocase protein TatA
MTDLGLVLVVVLVLAIIWRGPKTLPRLGQALGRGVREARREAAETREDLARRTNGTDDDTPQPGA